MSHNTYDLDILLHKAALWRSEAAMAMLDEVRAFCLAEADRCERRVQQSRSTPLFRDDMKDR
jgi:hypothetical protein